MWVDKGRKFGLLFIFLLLGLTNYAQVDNYVWTSLAGSYSALIDNKELAKPAFGGGGSLGVGYELHKKHFLFQTGLECAYLSFNNKIDNQQIEYNGVDSEGDNFLFIHQFSKWTNKASLLEVEIPLLFGGQFGKIYFLVGPRLNFTAQANCHASALVSSSAQYDYMFGQWTDMNNHGLYTNRQISGQKKSFSTNVDIGLAAEIGYVFGQSNNNIAYHSRVNYRLSLFAQYGLLNRYNGTSYGELLSYDNIDTWPGVAFDMNYIYASSAAEINDIKLNELQVGVRFTILFTMPKKKICVICRQ